MSNRDEIRHQGIKIDEVHDDLRRFAEAMADVPRHLTRIEENVYDIQAEMKLWRALWQDHEGRITKLETA